LLFYAKPALSYANCTSLSAHINQYKDKATTFSLLLRLQMQSHQPYMYRCLQLALLGRGSVAPNPMVGAVLVHNGRIIGEGWHKVYGGPHAEVVCIDSVQPAHRHLIPASTIYVSLEPCAHWGKTPPCADLIIRENIKNVVIGCRDPFPLVAGKGIEKLKAAGIEVTVGVLEQECLALNKRFFLFHREKRPYIRLKWAQTSDGKINSGDASKRLLISGPFANRLVHRWRCEEASILVGTNTALADDPALTTRLWPGKKPVRLVVDLGERLPAHLHLFDATATTIVFTFQRHTVTDAAQLRNAAGGVFYYRVNNNSSLVHQIAEALYGLQIQSVLIEGGARLLQSFIDARLWDEAAVIVNSAMIAAHGLPAPVLHNHSFNHEEQLYSDTVRYYRPL
jgi:diaminohydroxyphosphoribosylaminopyrimidine deaminase/5-amino-6-(5-phosphoribosylamino)uracil reductase